MGIFLRIAVRNLLQASRRNGVLALALAGVTLLLTMMLSLSAGLRENMVRSATTLAAGHVNVAGFYKTTPTDAQPIVTDYRKVRALVEAKTPGLDIVLERHRGLAKLVTDEGSTMSALVGLVPAEEARLRATLTLAKEDDYKENGSQARVGDLSRLGEPGTIVLFAGMAKRLHVAPGESITAVAESRKGAANSRELTLIGVAEDVGMLSLFTSLLGKQELLELYQLPDDTTGALMVYLDDIAQAPEVMRVLRAALEAEGYLLMDHEAKFFFAKIEGVSSDEWTGQKLDLTTWDDEVSWLAWVVKAFDGISLFVVALLAAIIGVGVMNTMWMSVRERTGEVGTLRAIGMGRGQVLLMFLLEAIVLGAAASATGALGGAALAAGLDAAAIRVPFEAARFVMLSDRIHFAPHLIHVVAATGGISLVTGLAALWPAFRAATLQPVTAMGQNVG